MLREALQLHSIYDDLEEVRVAILKDLGRVKLPHGWERLERGAEIRLPAWLAESLEAVGAVEVRESRLSEIDVTKYLLEERDLPRGSLVKLRTRFYAEVKRLMKSVKEAQMSARDVSSIPKLVKLEADIRDLIKLRLNKIAHIALLGGKLEDIENSALLREIYLLLSLRKLVNEWMEGSGNGESSK